ncbi:hypothetical protein KC878_00205 [Candidatus Saccharibacteria bacterium]|nr:hypothetical protein [Candidatus Saccharibacteria bacterium]MCB9821037.1 hypothetical protein [Candidatus Nomurabacteria bacterium]
MKFGFHYSVETELNRVRYTLGKRDFFKQNNYKPRLPSGFDLEAKDAEMMTSQIELELELEKTKKLQAKILNEWQECETDISQYLMSFGLPVPPAIDIFLTKYGVGGSYWPPNRIILNMATDKRDPFLTLVHELIHLVIQAPIIDGFNLEHWDKESLVDYQFMTNPTLKRIFPNYSYQRQAPSKLLLKKVGWL